MPGYLIFLAYAALLATPLLLAAMAGRPVPHWLDALSSGLALVALAALLAEFLLSGRFRAISQGVGMDRTMRLHRIAGLAALAGAMIHPFLYVTPPGPSLGRDGVAPGIGPDTWLGLPPLAILTGIIAFILAPVLVLTAIFRDQTGWRYESWRLLHGLGALGLVMAGTHHAISAGRHSGEPALAAFWLALAGLAALSLTWVYLLRPLAKARRPWRVASVRRAALKTWELVVAPEGHAGLDFRAGQFVWLKIGGSAFGLAENPFSIASAPGDPRGLVFLIKEAGDFTRSLGNIPQGTPAWIDGPHGHLTFEGHDGKAACRRIALIAGGIGIAPMFSLLDEMARRSETRPVTLIYGNRTAAQIAWPERLAALQARLDLEVIHVLSEPPEGWPGKIGQLDGEMLRAALAGHPAADWLCYLCGPPAMLDAALAALKAMGVPARQTIAERFVY